MKVTVFDQVYEDGSSHKIGLVLTDRTLIQPARDIYVNGVLECRSSFIKTQRLYDLGLGTFATLDYRVKGTVEEIAAMFNQETL